VKLHARLYDDKGRFLREEIADWSLAGLKGSVTDGKSNRRAMTRVSKRAPSGGRRGVSGEARAARDSKLPITETFESYAPNSTPSRLGERHGRKVSSLRSWTGRRYCRNRRTKRCSSESACSSGQWIGTDYTYEGDVRASMRRRQMGDIGLTAQRYSLVLYGNTQQLKIEPWEPEIQRSVTVPFAWGTGQVVSPEAARREYAGRFGTRARERRGRRAIRSRRRG